MVVPTTTYDAGFTLSQGGFAVVDVLNPATQTSHLVTLRDPEPLSRSRPSASSIPGGKVLLSIGNEVVADASTSAASRPARVTRTLDLNTITGDQPPRARRRTRTRPRRRHVAQRRRQSIFFDLATFTVVGIYDHGSFSQPNDVVFTPDGSRARGLAAGHGARRRAQARPGLRALARGAGVGDRRRQPDVHDRTTCESGQPCAIYFSLAGAGPQQ